jgi:hypothetical protein
MGAVSLRKRSMGKQESQNMDQTSYSYLNPNLPQAQSNYIKQKISPLPNTQQPNVRCIGSPCFLRLTNSEWCVFSFRICCFLFQVWFLPILNWWSNYRFLTLTYWVRLEAWALGIWTSYSDAFAYSCLRTIELKKKIKNNAPSALGCLWGSRGWYFSC